MYDDGLPPLRDVINEHGLQAKKSLGQNFLTDLNLTGKIARSAGDLENSIIYEVGPGPGALTRGLLMNGASRVVAVEMDHRCIDALAKVSDAYDGRLTVHEGDAMQMDEASLIGDTGGKDVHVVANLPYNVGTALLVKWMTGENWKPWFKSLTLMFQKEVGERIIAEPRTKAYGRLSVLCQYRADCRILFDIPRQAFIPPPKVTSAIVQIIPRDEAADAPKQKTLERVVSAAFNQRRKMLRASLKGLGTDPIPKLEAAGIKETARAEELSIDDFCRLANQY
ncbi:16S rRNA (adenine(1518)-N(6)/adenine(1519)-N(6))-dimethyltransferase RsmA [Pseudemcibacter aquimaris]|uniref:16S rRNA (adenine(1518)-N(6)/adenine(1519)-N(6))- dimethyltransferase RsmA n=1 Tax=Pseudemcibacter aquimaris TaxID=2857064 RepID=UPI002012483B|nr:16S rRNA (adenine(1518)-N(6)/adenine(1519)-N(6))-dimethyltransferase RsmA [Pseudemcibacter aquimaris]MCC3859962.1 16S rRNA (adenine(1518)-N(6)/adenine(1519)-N(6))-dimethyltransferase RsmA [Pseudemcibacter aquimaris]WDU57294.1 16S rRNA (adenine(1518)-N(6)/adenine(1519)-N(6))-dimethyltransferase RsmA [Pseudemcibacter aquimaris]